MPENLNQKVYFERLNEVLNGDVVPWLCEELKLNYAAARRLVRGETELKADQLLAIAGACPEAVEKTTTLLKGTQMRILYRRAFSDIPGFLNYLSAIEGLLNEALKHPNGKLYYCARDLPLFIFLKDKRLLTFKVRLWCRTLKSDGLMALPAPVYAKAEELIHLYREIESEELWDTHAIAVQGRQLKMFYEAGVLSLQELRDLIEALRITLLWVEVNARDESKGGAGKYRLWNADYLSLNNTAAFKYGDNTHTVYTTAHAKYYSSSNAEAYNDFRLDWKQHLQYARPITHSTTTLFEQWRNNVHRELQELREYAANRTRG